MPLRIAMFAHNYPPHPGGLEVMVESLATGLAERHDVTVITSSYEGAAGVSREQGVTVHRLPTWHTLEARGVPYPVPRGPGARRAMAAVAAVDVVHAHGALYLQTLLAWSAARRARAPWVVTEHVGFVQYDRPGIEAIERGAWRLLGDPVTRRCDALVTYNARVHEWLAARTSRSVAFVGNGVDLHTFRPRQEEERRALRRALGLPETGMLVLFAGRESPKKNLDVILRIPRAGFTLVVCGARRHLSGDGVIDLGVLPHDRMAELYGCVDAMVHAATGEGFPLAVQEAIASGTPVVLRWDEGYARWLPREMVVACDATAEMGPALAALLADDARRVALSGGGRRFVEGHWSWAATVAAYEEIYHDVIGRERPR